LELDIELGGALTDLGGADGGAAELLDDGGDFAGAQILALVASDEKMRDAAPAPLSLSKRLPKIHALTVKWQRNLLMERHFLHPAFYSAGNQNALLAVL
jgi:hypothetical protein